MPFTPIDNEQAAAVNKVIERLVFDVAINAAKAAAVAQAPWLEMPVVSAVFNYLLNLFGGYIYEALSQNATAIVINVQSEQSREAYSKAVDRLQAAHEKGSADEIEKAKQDFKDTLGVLISWDNGSL